MRIAMLGTHGVPARYGGFETAVEEIGQRLVARGHEVVVYCRGDDRSPEYLGMRRVLLPALRHPVTETLTHTALSVGHLVRHRADVALVFNPANASLLPVLRAAHIPVAVHVDGLDWLRGKWGAVGKRYFRANVRLAVRLADEIISDAVEIRNYYRRHYRTESVLLRYGAPILDATDCTRLSGLDLEPQGYHLAVARVEPENQLDLMIEGYLGSRATKPLVVIGSAPYPSEHERRVRRLAATDSRVRILGAVWDQDLLNDLYAGSLTYLHGHSVGGTNPSLLRAMGSGASVIAWDSPFNQEVLADAGCFFDGADGLARLLEQFEEHPALAGHHGIAARKRAAAHYRWDDVADGYESLCRDLHARTRTRAKRRTRRVDVPSPRSVEASGSPARWSPTRS